MNKTTQGILLVLLSALCYGLVPTFAKQIYALDVSVLGVIFIRFLTAFIILGIFLLIKDRKLLSLPFSRIPTFLVLGISYFSVVGFTLTGLKFAPVGVVILILYTYPILILFYEILFLKKPCDLRVATLLLGSLFGMVLLLGTSFAGTYGTGITLAFFASLSFACYVIVSGRNASIESPFTLGLYTYAISAVIAGTAYFVTNGLSVQIVEKSITPLLLLAIVGTIFSSIFFLQGLKYLETTKAAAVAMLEPLFAILFAFILNGEILTKTQFIGGVILFTCSFLISFKKK